MTFYPACGILKTANAKGKNAVISIDRFEEILGELAEELRGRTGLALPVLSCGMSDDFEIAVEEGSTLVRLGRIVFSADYDLS